MTVKEFNQLRKPFFIDSDTLLIKYPTTKHMNCDHAQWFTDMGMPWCHVIRGYLIENEYAMLYWDDFEIPNVTVSLLVYLFEILPNIKYIGLGCKKGNPGEIWEPKLKVYRNEEN